MTDGKMALIELIEKGSDHDLVREMLAYSLYEHTLFSKERQPVLFWAWTAINAGGFLFFTYVACCFSFSALAQAGK